MSDSPLPGIPVPFQTYGISRMSFFPGGSFPSYSLDEVVTLTGNAGGSGYSIDASLVTDVPDSAMTLVLLGSALSGLALIKRKLA